MGSATDKGQREEDEPVGQQDNAADSLHSQLISVLALMEMSYAIF